MKGILKEDKKKRLTRFLSSAGRGGEKKILKKGNEKITKQREQKEELRREARLVEFLSDHFPAL